MDINKQHGSINIIPFENMENVLLIHDFKSYDHHNKFKNDSPVINTNNKISKNSETDTEQNSLLKNTTSKKLQTLYTYIDSMNCIMQSDNNDIICTLLNTIEILEHNKNFLNNLISSFDERS